MQANCQECPAGLAHSAQNRGKDLNLTKEFCRLNPYVPNRKLKPPQMRRFEFSGRGERIRTFDILVPNQALYQTELHPETRPIITVFFSNANFYLNFLLVYHEQVFYHINNEKKNCIFYNFSGDNGKCARHDTRCKTDRHNGL